LPRWWRRSRWIRRRPRRVWSPVVLRESPVTSRLPPA
ncbi:hypothetical protein NJB18182_26840, partial [Mycobacterium montefiorense]